MRRVVCFLAIGWTLAAGTARATDIPLHDWPVPSPAGIHTLADYTSPLVFVGVAPCRLVDTRGGAPLGGGILSAGSTRNYTMTGNCNIPATAKALSMNVTVTGTLGAGFISIWPQGGTMPTVSTLNYASGDTIANAALVPLSTGGGISVVAGVSGTHLIIDVNGYFAQQSGDGNGLYVFANTAAYAIQGYNNSTTCSGVCGIYGVTLSDTPGTIGIGGAASSASARNYGVYGFSGGIGNGSTLAPANVTAGVWGYVATSDTQAAGVMGSVSNSNVHSAGIYGEQGNASGYGGMFHNNGGTQIFTYLSGGSTYGLITGAAINGGSLSISGAKSFISPHPEDPSKEIKYVAIEGPSADVFLRGTARIVDGIATIEIPEHFRLTAREGTYQTTLTPVGGRASLWVESEGPQGIVVRGTGEAFHYVVWAERDVLHGFTPVIENRDFTPEILAQTNALATMPEAMKDVLVKNGTLNPDGSFNETTARRLGWTVPPPPDPIVVQPSPLAKN